MFHWHLFSRLYDAAFQESYLNVSVSESVVARFSVLLLLVLYYVRFMFAITFLSQDSV